jgi:hypothetical protein
VLHLGLWDQVLGMEQMGPICFSALSSGGILWISNVLIWQSFVRSDLVFYGGRSGFGFRLGQAIIRSVDLSCFVGLRPDREQTNIARYVPIRP